MQFEIKELSKNTTRITTVDERWYVTQNEAEKKTYVPSVTWIASHYPKGVGYYKWLANKGWDESQEIMTTAGTRGSKIHSAIEVLLNGEEVKMSSVFTNTENGMDEELTADEYEAIMAFVDWYNLTKPKTIKTEFNVIGKKYAGTVDYICTIKKKVRNKVVTERFIVDFKTSQQIWPSHVLQVSAYKHLIDKMTKKEHKIAILQVGYRYNKRRFKFTELEDQYDLFKAAYKIWDYEVKQKQPLQRDFPNSLKLDKDEKKD